MLMHYVVFACVLECFEICSCLFAVPDYDDHFFILNFGKRYDNDNCLEIKPNH